MLTEHIKEHEILGTSKDISDLKTSQVTQDLRIQAAEAHVADTGVHVTTAWKLAMEAKSAVYYRATIAERNAITGIKEGDICRVGDDGTGKFASYIYSSSASWEILSKQDWENLNITWEAIVDKPDMPTFLGYTFANRTTDPAAPAAGYLTMFFKNAVAYVKDAAGGVASFAASIGAAPAEVRNLLPITLTSASKTLTAAEANYDGFILSGPLTANVNLVVQNMVRPYQIINNCTGAFTVTVKTAAGTGIVCGIGARKLVFCDGTNIVECANDAAVMMGSTVTGTDILEYIKTAFKNVYGAKKMWFNVGADCTNIPSTAWWRIEAEGSATSIVIKARIFGGYDEWMNCYSSSAWKGWKQQVDFLGGAMGYGGPIDCGSNSFKDVVLANPGKTRFKVTNTTTDGPVYGVNYMVDVIWFVASSTAASCYFKAIARNVVNVDNFTEYEIWCYAGTWGTWKHVRDQYGVKVMGYDDIGSGETLDDILAFMPETGIAERWFNIQTAAGTPVSPDALVNYRTLAIGSQGGCILVAYGSNTNHSEWINRYNGTTLTWTGWIRVLDAQGRSMKSTTVVIASGESVKTKILANINTLNFASAPGATNSPEETGAATKYWEYAVTWYNETAQSCRVVANHVASLETWEIYCSSGTWGIWTQLRDNYGMATKISVPVIGATPCLPVILANPYAPQFSASGVTDITIHAAAAYGMIHCDWRSGAEVRVTFKDKNSFSEYENYYTSSAWKGWVKTKDADGNSVNANSLGGTAAASYALKTDTAPDSSKLGGVAAASYALKTDNVASATNANHVKAPLFYSGSYTGEAIASYLLSVFGSTDAWQYGASGAIYNGNWGHINRFYYNGTKVYVNATGLDPMLQLTGNNTEFIWQFTV